MKNKTLLFASLFITSTFYAQINFESEKILLDQYQALNTNSEILLADLNNDGTKDLITVSSSEGIIVVHPNISGNYTEVLSRLVLQNNNEYPSGISVIDVDNDNLDDIIICNKYDDKISWFKNLGDFNFSEITLLKNIINGPELSLISDVDNDGLKDIIVNLDTNDTLIWLKNTGNNTFMEPQFILTNNLNDIKKILAKDLNNDGFPEIIYGIGDGRTYWLENLGDGLFSAKIELGIANSGISFDFFDINNDNYLDYISTANNNLSIKINQMGDTFGTNQYTNIGANFGHIKIADIDQDGLSDIIGSSGTNISYIKQYSNGVFYNTPFNLITSGAVQYFIADDINNDNKIDFILPLYSSSNTNRRLLAYTRSQTSNINYNEQIISNWNHSIFTIKVGDLDGDDFNDIVTCANYVIWNKNKGNGEFTSYKIISANIGPTIFNYDIELADIDNDGDKDIVVSNTIGIEIYYNNGNGNFTLGYNLPLAYHSRNIEIADLNGDNFKDIIMTFRTGVSTGNISLAWIPNLTGTTFDNLTTIGISVHGYEPYLLACADMDNDNDIDIITYSNEYSSLHLHNNNGNGLFTYNQIGSNFSAVCLTVEDYDNDGDIDIFAAGNYYPGIYMIKNNGNGLFSNRTLIDNKKADELKFADLDGNGFKEIIGIVNESSILRNTFYYNNNNTDFENQIIIDTDNLSGKRNISIGDLNNDNKPDIVQSLYSTKVSYFLNSSNLSVQNPEIKDSIAIYPIPFTETIQWKLNDNNLQNYEISIFDLTGKLIYSKKEVSTPSLNLNFLPKGTYIININSESNCYSRKIVKN